MTHYENESDDRRPNLNPTQAELNSLMTALTQRLTNNKQATVTELTGAIPPAADAPLPRAFIVPINPNVVRGVFYPESLELVPVGESEAEYTTPYRLEETDDTSDVRENVGVRCSARMAGTDILRIESFILTLYHDKVNGSVDVEYVRNGKRVSPNDVELDEGFLLSDERIFKVLQDLKASERPFTLDDAEKLHQLVDILDD